MSKMRSVQTTIWTKSERFRQCDAIEKLLFLFLITNPETNLCGAFEMMLDDVAHYTGIDVRNLPHVFEGLERKELATYEDGWIIIPNYKAVYDNPKVQRGIERELDALPTHIKDRLSKTIPNSNSNSNSKREETAKPSTRYDNLVKKYGKAAVDDMLETVDNYCASKGKKYKDHVATAANWLKRDGVATLPGYGIKATPKLPKCTVCGGKLKEYEPGGAMCENRDSEWRLLNDLWVEVSDE